jgi:hypothetical protein
VTVAVQVLAVHDTATDDAPAVIARSFDPELAALFVSPGYEAWAETLPAVRPVNVTEQLEPERLQVEEENVTDPAPDWDHVIVSPDIDPKLPVTAAVHVEVPPTANELKVHDTVVVVIA